MTTMAKRLRDAQNRWLEAGEKFVLIKAPSTPHNDRPGASLVYLTKPFKSKLLTG